jgi:excisionase family DNA binding protein
MYLTYDDVQQMFSVSRGTVKRWVSQRKLRSIRLGNRMTRFRLRDVEAFEQKLLTRGRP